MKADWLNLVPRRCPAGSRVGFPVVREGDIPPLMVVFITESHLAEGVLGIGLFILD